MGHTKASQLCTQFCAKMTTCVEGEVTMFWSAGRWTATPPAGGRGRSAGRTPSASRRPRPPAPAPPARGFAGPNCRQWMGLLSDTSRLLLTRLPSGYSQSCLIQWNTSIRSCHNIFRIFVKFGGSSDNSAVPRRGFKLSYRQIPC